MKKQLFYLKAFIALILLTVTFNGFTQEKQNFSTNSTLQDQSFFVENKGQWPSEVLYLTRLGGLDAWITQKGVLYDFYRIEEIKNNVTNETFPEDVKPSLFNRIGHVVLCKLQGNKINLKTEGKQKLQGYYNYLIGNNPSKHATHVALYKEVVLKNVYNGIDIRYYFDKGSLRFDYIVHPGADPNQITFSLKGSNNNYINEKGNLTFTTRFGEVQMTELLSYQYQGNEKKKVESKFIRKGNDWKIDVANYDPNKELIIDPLIFSTYIGGSDIDRGRSIAYDNNKNIYIVGESISTDYPVTILGTYQATNQGLYDVVVSKFNPTATSLIYSTYIGGDNIDYSSAIQVNSSGEVFITGYTKSNNFDVTLDALQNTFGGGIYDAFVSRLNSLGTSLLYSTYLGGSGTDMALSITIDANNSAYVAGYTTSSNFPLQNAYQTSLGGGTDIFISKISSTGQNLLYSTYFGGTGDDYCYSIAVNTSGSIYFTGYTKSNNFPTTNGAFQTSLQGTSDAFITKLYNNTLTYSTYLGGSNEEVSRSLKIDAAGNAYITGYTASNNDFDVTSGAYQSTYGGGTQDAFITKINTNGTALVYSTYLGGSNDDYGYSIALDNNVPCITGYSFSFDFPTTPGAFQTTKLGTYEDAFIAKVSSSQGLVYSTYVGGNNVDRAYSLVMDNNAALITGYTNSTNYPLSANAYQTNFGGVSDILLTKICLMGIALDTTQGSQDQNVCINTPIENIKFKASGSTAIGTPLGLPAGVTAYWSQPFYFNIPAVIITGTPSVEGTYNYSIPIIGSCDTVIVTGTIVVDPENTVTLTSNNDLQTVCINTPIENISYVTTGATGIGTPTGLPTGITATFAGNAIFISGTPTEDGEFPFSIPLTGGCGNTQATGFLTVNSNTTVTLTSASGTDNQTVVVNNAITDITYELFVANGIGTPNGLPNGVTASYQDFVVTISGTPTETGVFNYDIPLTGGCGSVTNITGTITVNSPSGIETAGLMQASYTLIPNPVKNQLVISCNKEFNNSQLILRNVLGQEINTWNDIKGKTYSIDMQDYTKGLYYIEIIEKDSTRTILKVMKE